MKLHPARTPGLLPFIAALFVTCVCSTASAVELSGSGTEADPYHITNVTELNEGVRQDLNAHYVVLADIDMANQPFTTIGLTSDAPFSGTFNGNGHTISNAGSVSTPSGPLFGYLGDPSQSVTPRIHGLTISNAVVSGATNLGALVAVNEGGLIESCNASGSVTGQSSSNGGAVGGLVGINRGTILECAFSGSVSAPAEGAGTVFVGGLVGENGDSGGIGTCRSDATVTDELGSATEAYFGGLIGRNLGWADQSHADGPVTCQSSGAFAAGFVGLNEGWMGYSFSRGSVTGINNVGGIAAISAGEIDESYATGSVAGTDMVGGAIGRAAGWTYHVYARGQVTGASNTGGLIGGLYDDATSESVYQCYWDVETTGQPASAGGTGKTTAEMQQASTFEEWDFESVWRTGTDGYPALRTLQINQVDPGTVEGNTGAFTLTVHGYGFTTGSIVRWDGADRPTTYVDSSTLSAVIPASDVANVTVAHSVPVTIAVESGEISNALPVDLTIGRFDGGVGTPANPFQISTITQLNRVRDLMNASFILTANIDLAGETFAPIRSASQPFNGTFDGNGFSISNWAYSETEDGASNTPFYTARTGFFAYLGQAATVSNLSLQNCSVSANRTAGILAGQSEGKIINCSSSGSVHANVAGGLIGINGPIGFAGFQISFPDRDGSIIGSHSAALVTGPEIWTNTGYFYPGAGGLVGNNHRLVRDCFATGAVFSKAGFVGGLTGMNFGLLERSHATGNTTLDGTIGAAGGLVGGNAQASGYISTCYATGDVTGDNELGGLAGYSESALFNSYSTGRVTGSHYVGGLAALLRETMHCYATGLVTADSQTGGVAADVFSGYIQDGTYWDTETTGQPTSASGTGKTTTEMKTQSTYVGWNFDYVWMMGAEGYPVLRTNAALFPAIKSLTEDQYVSYGTPVAITVEATGTAPLTYKWFLIDDLGHHVLIPGATGSSLNFPFARLADSRQYVVQVTNPAGYLYSGRTRLSVSAPPAPQIVSAPSDQTVNSGDSLVLTVVATDDLPLTYQWSSDAGEIPGATGPTLTLTNIQASQAGIYFVTINNGATSTSVGLYLTVLAPAIDAITPSSVATNSGAFTLSVSGSNFANTNVIFWNGSARPTTFVDTNTLTAAIPASDIASAGILTAVITVQSPGGDTSNAKALLVSSASVSSAQSDISPLNSSISVTTAPLSGGSAGATTVLTNNTDGSPAASSNAAITVANYATNPEPSPSFDVGGGYVDVQATGVDSTDMAATSFYYPSTIVDPTETSLVLQYYNGGAWVPVLSSGGTVPTKDMTDNSDGTISGGKFLVTFDDTSTPKITELTGTVFTFAPLPSVAPKHKPKITNDPQDVTVTTGGTAIFTITAESSGPVSYQWFSDKKNGPPIAGATGSTLVLTNVQLSDAGSYVVTVTNSKGSTTSSKAKLTVLPHPPVVISQPQPARASPGSTVSFSVSSSSETTVNFQWYFNGRKIGGATRAELIIKKVSSSDAGSYAVIISNAGGSVTTAPAVLTVDRTSGGN